METPTFAAMLTPEGIVVAGGLITAFVQLIKTVFPIVDEKVPGAIMAFTLSAALYMATALVVGVPTPDAYLTVLASWLACATAAVGVYSTAKFAGKPDA
jgi:hypothetical protein